MESLYVEALIEIVEVAKDWAKNWFEENKEAIYEGLIKWFTQEVAKATFSKISGVCFSVIKSKNKVFILIRDKLEKIKAWVNKNRKIIVSGVCSIVGNQLGDWFIKNLGTGMVGLGSAAIVGGAVGTSVGTGAATVAQIATTAPLMTSIIGAGSIIALPMLPIATGAAVGIATGVGIAKLFGRGKNKSQKLYEFQGELIPLL